MYYASDNTPQTVLKPDHATLNPYTTIMMYASRSADCTTFKTECTVLYFNEEEEKNPTNFVFEKTCSEEAISYLRDGGLPEISSC